MRSAMTIDRHLEPLRTAIQHNCEISDASGSGIFSICGMALRLRDLNKWEQGFSPWEENEPAALVNWIDQKEQLWENLEGQPFGSLPLNGGMYDPFDTQGINTALVPHKLFYGAGYAHALKPTFFLARVAKTLRLEGLEIIILDQELIRDLLTLPALGQDGAIIIRRDAGRLFLWDQMAYLKNSGKRFLSFALKQSGLPDAGIENRKAHFDTLQAVQEQTYIYHEVGEIKDTVFDREVFRQMIAAFPRTSSELLIRTVKDLLADTGPVGTLSHLIATQQAAGLGFYAAFQDGLFLPLFPELRQAFERFASDRDWDGIENARNTGYERAGHYARTLMDIFSDARYSRDTQGAADRIHTLLIEPLIEGHAVG